MTIERFNDRGFLSDVVAHADMVWTSGVVPHPNLETIAEQTHDVLVEIDRRLAIAGSERSRLLSVNIWLADMEDWTVINRIWSDWLGDAPSPARAVVGATLMKPFRIEIAATALRFDHS